MLAVDERLVLPVLDDALADVAVKLGVGEAEVVLVGLAAETVGRRLVDQDVGKSEQSADRLDSRTVKFEHGLKSPTLSP